MGSEEKILEALSEKAMKAGEIAEFVGLDKDDVSKTLKTLKAKGKVISPKRCYYGLPE
ncbi:winged helix-turn-helix domain-containing protein [Dethiosulfovibrio sp. F2B]|uniref:winged helix-turn-helix domain-containing protein n=1 Tax=Dethiosulfovibrio faecalis TaxID=2720018 RepID=UPI001F2F7372|nr:winged helix-turn-helix domain-containing protein [Dethiosulfovibrio faecalis]MCF4152597.1 winged helix-turn-helix domain-containing protein [Dethiosulfovibrio faecalis]